MSHGVKLVVIGDAGVGKTSILNRAVHDEFSETTQPTTSEFIRWRFTSSDQRQTEPIQFEIWDTAGQEKFRALTKTYFRNARAILMVFDATNPKTQQELNWYHDMIHENCTGGSYAVGLVGNKSDLAKDANPGALDELQKLHQADFALYCSARTGENIGNIFEEFLKTDPVQRVFRPTTEPNLTEPNLTPNGKKHKNCCKGS
jgi:Ras-related protein Rab-5C